MFPDGECLNLRDTIVADCNCVAICKFHSIRLRRNFPTMICPSCGGGMTGPTFTIKGGWERVN
jgi:hypothetical protein